MNAYDYDRQEWVEGEAARPLLRQQAQDHLAIVKGLNGQDYLDSIRKRDEPRRLVEDEIKKTEDFLKTL